MGRFSPAITSPSPMRPAAVASYRMPIPTANLTEPAELVLDDRDQRPGVSSESQRHQNLGRGHAEADGHHGDDGQQGGDALQHFLRHRRRRETP